MARTSPVESMVWTQTTPARGRERGDQATHVGAHEAAARVRQTGRPTRRLAVLFKLGATTVVDYADAADCSKAIAHHRLNALVDAGLAERYQRRRTRQSVLLRRHRSCRCDAARASAMTPSSFTVERTIPSMRSSSRRARGCAAESGCLGWQSTPLARLRHRSTWLEKTRVTQETLREEPEVPRSRLCKATGAAR